MRCCHCGRRLFRAPAATIAATASEPEGYVGRACAIKAGFIKPRPGLLARARRRVKVRVTSQLDLEV